MEIQYSGLFLGDSCVGTLGPAHTTILDSRRECCVQLSHIVCTNSLGTVVTSTGVLAPLKIEIKRGSETDATEEAHWKPGGGRDVREGTW